MQNSSWHEEIGAQVKVGQIIVFAMVMGCSTFMAIAIFINSRQINPQQNDPVLTWPLLIVTGICVAARITLPGFAAEKNFQKILSGTWGERNQHLQATGDAGRLWHGYFTKTIIGSALLEGAASFNIIGYFVEGPTWCLLVATLLILWIMSGFPTKSQVFHWIEEQLERLDQQRNLG